MKIVWRTIPDFPEYEINRLGEVRRKSTGRVLKPFDDRRGYLRVSLSGRNMKVHLLVAKMFVPNPHGYPDGDTSILECPCCGSGEWLHNADESAANFCGQCGQAIDWTEPEVHCGDCAHLTFSDCYGECGKGYKGIVQPGDSCGKGEHK